MLYVSRIIGYDRYGIVDTDDGVETEISRWELNQIIDELDIKIEGVTTTTRYERGRWHLDIVRVDPYQLDSSMSRAQLKMLTFGGVEVSVHGDMVTSVKLAKGTQEAIKPVRLSKFGSSCGDLLFKSMTFTIGQHCMTVIIDDNITLSSMSIKDFYNRGVVLDIRELTNQKNLGYVLNELSHNLKVFDSNYYIATDEVADSFKLNVLLDTKKKLKFLSASEIFSNPERMSNAVEKKYGQAFAQLAETEYKINYGGTATAVDYVSWVKKPEVSRILESRDFDSMIDAGFIKVFSMLQSCTNLDYTTIRRFWNYIIYFEIPQYLKDAFVKLTYDFTHKIVEIISSPDWWTRW